MAQWYKDWPMQMKKQTNKNKFTINWDEKTTGTVSRGMIQRSVYFFNVKLEMPILYPMKLSSRLEKKCFIRK